MILQIFAQNLCPTIAARFLVIGNTCDRDAGQAPNSDKVK